LNKLIHHISVTWWIYILGLFTFVAFFHKFLANDLPVLANVNENVECLICQDYLYELGWINKNPRRKKYDVIMRPPIYYSPYAISYTDVNIPPFQGAHILGTDTLGRDVFAGLIYGTWKAFIVGIFAIGIAFIIALIVGGVAGYCKGETYETSILGLLVTGLLFLISTFYVITELRGKNLLGGLGVLVLAIGFIFLSKRYLAKLGKTIKIKPDRWADRLIEVREVIPGIFLVLASLSLFKTASIWNVVLVIGFISWSNMARYIRAEFIRVKSQNYFLASKSIGLSDIQLIRNHIIPNALDPILATVAFAISSAILVEASLSFLGIGVPPQEITWGALLAEARATNAWWLALFPGICIFLVLISLHAFSDKWRKRHK
jgi:peptide/nickel transport system permease protein